MATLFIMNETSKNSNNKKNSTLSLNETNEKNKLIGAFPNMMMMMFNQLSDFDVSLVNNNDNFIDNERNLNVSLLKMQINKMNNKMNNNGMHYNDDNINQESNQSLKQNIANREKTQTSPMGNYFDVILNLKLVSLWQQQQIDVLIMFVDTDNYKMDINTMIEDLLKTNNTDYTMTITKIEKKENIIDNDIAATIINLITNHNNANYNYNINNNPKTNPKTIPSAIAGDADVMYIPMLMITMTQKGQQSLAIDDGTARKCITLMSNDGAMMLMTMSNDNNNINVKQTLMAILTVVFNKKNYFTTHNNDTQNLMKKMKMMMMMIKKSNTNSSNNNKLITNIMINNDNIISYDCFDDHYMCVFLSKKSVVVGGGGGEDNDDSIHIINSKLVMFNNEAMTNDDYDEDLKDISDSTMMLSLLSHSMISFTVNDINLIMMMIFENDFDVIIKKTILTDTDLTTTTTTTTTSTTSQSNTNKSEYAFEKTLNNDSYNVANFKDSYLMKIIIDNKKKIMINVSKVMDYYYIIIKYFYYYSKWESTMTAMMTLQIANQLQQKQQQMHQQQQQQTKINNNQKMMMISELLQSLFKESDQQSGIVSNNSYNKTIDNLKTIIHNNNKHNINEDDDYPVDNNNKQTNDTQIMMMMMMMKENANQMMNISELLLLFSHINKNDNNATLIVIKDDNTVNITCDFNYLNYNKHKIINDQNLNNNNNNNNKNNNNNASDKEATATTKTTTLSSSLIYKQHLHKLQHQQQKKVFEGYTKFDDLIKYQANEQKILNANDINRRAMRLCGGGEGSLSGGASGWGSPPSTNTNNNSNNNNNPNAGQWGTAAQSTPQQNWSSNPQQSQQQQQPPAQQPQQPPNPINPVAGVPLQNPKPLVPGQQPQGWNAPPGNPQNPNQPPQQQQQLQQQQQQQQQQQPQPNNGNGAPGAPPGPLVPGAPGIVGGGTSAIAAKNQLEQLNSMREALFSQDGWGCQNVNQDTNWDIPGSPEPGPRGGGDPATAAAGATQWKSHIVNNGTELWEANLRNGGQPPPQPAQKVPWSHTPTTNLGGTWGEDDDGGGESANVWTGAPNNPQGQNWNQGAGNAAGATGGNGGNGGNGGGSTAMWPATPNAGGPNTNMPKKENEWTGGGNVGGGGGGGNNWGDPREMRPSGGGGGGGPIDMRNIDPRASAGVDMRMMDSRDQMQGNLRGVTGRLNGSSDMWHGNMGGHGGQMPMNKTVGPGGATAGVGNNQWPGSQVGGPKDNDMNKPGGWGEQSPPATRRPLGGGGFDDGTSFWGTQSRGPAGGPGDSSWNKIPDPMGRNNLVRNPIGAPGAGIGPGGLPPGRISGAGMKPEANTWGGIHGGPGGRQSTWDEPHTPNWDDKGHGGIGAGGGGGGLTPWNEGPNVGGGGGGGGPLWNKNKPSWPENELNNEWGQSQPNKLGNTSSEIIRSSKPFRILVENGYKKDEAEIALRSTNMNIDEAMELLQQQQQQQQQQQRNNSGMEPWHHSSGGGGGGGGFDHNTPFPNRYPGPQPSMPFPPNNQKLPNTGNGGGNPNLSALNNNNNLNPMQLNKHLPHNPSTPAFMQQAAAASQSAGGGQPTAHHLRNLVQQIQKAVQAGYLNHQILNQPLAPQTLQLLNSLLNTIQQLQLTQQSIQRNGGVNNLQVQMTVQKQKQQISTLQQQIAQQQSVYIKSQAAGGNGGGGANLGGGTGNDFLRQNSAGGGGMGMGHNDPIGSIENNLGGLNLKQEPSYQSNTTSQQSRLNQWKLPPALDKPQVDPVDFSRAPGTTAKQSLPPTTPTSIGSLGIHNEPGPWSTGRNDAGGWPDSSGIDGDNKDWPSNQQSPAFTDLVPEFEPGKPWKVSIININLIFNCIQINY